MIKKPIPLVVWYSLLLVVVVISTYVGIHLVFQEPFSDPFFSSITPLQTMLEENAAKRPRTIPIETGPRPTLPPPQVTEKNKFSFNRFDNDPQNPVYILRVVTVGTVVEVDGAIQGTCVVISDEEKIKHTFMYKGNRGSYTLGIHKGGFGDYANTLETHSLNEMKSYIPSGTFIQLRISTRAYSLEERASLVTLIEQTREATSSADRKPILRPFAVEIVR